MSSGTPAQLTARPVDELGAVTDLFRCDPYRATMQARTCLARQATLLEQDEQDLRKPVGDRISGDYAKCRSCALGARVARRLKVVAAGPTNVPEPDDG